MPKPGSSSWPKPAATFAEPGDRHAVVDHDADAMDLTLTLNGGPPVRFGEIEVSGLDQVQPVERRLPWRPGELIAAERLEAGQRALREANLFSTIAVRLENLMQRGECRSPWS